MRSSRFSEWRAEWKYYLYGLNLLYLGLNLLLWSMVIPSNHTLIPTKDLCDLQRLPRPHLWPLDDRFPSPQNWTCLVWIPDVIMFLFLRDRWMDSIKHSFWWFDTTRFSITLQISLIKLVFHSDNQKSVISCRCYGNLIDRKSVGFLSVLFWTSFPDTSKYVIILQKGHQRATKEKYELFSDLNKK